MVVWPLGGVRGEGVALRCQIVREVASVPQEGVGWVEARVKVEASSFLFLF